jgi:hypothetical protein
MAFPEHKGFGDSIRLFIGQDPKESVGTYVFLQSLLEQTYLPVSVTVLTPQLAETLGIEDTESTNTFGKLRFAIPYLCNYKGGAIFLDGTDQLLRTSLAQLWAMREAWFGVQVVKHAYKTKHAKKYVGTRMEADNKDYPRKNWSSVAIWSCDYSKHQILTPRYISETSASSLHRFCWMPDERIGELPAEWNWLVGEQPYNPDAKIAHMTLGLPGFEHYRHCDYAQEWTDTLKRAATGLQYLGR